MIDKLNNSWILWYDKKNHNIGSDDWDKFLVRISSFETVNFFCILLEKIIPLSQLPNGASYHFFKLGIEPRWEDKNNFEGGKWVLVLQKQILQKTDKIWSLTLASVIGGSFKNKLSREITGIVGTIKKTQFRIAIWTKKSNNKKLQINIGKIWKKLIQDSLILENFIIEFIPHNIIPVKK
jgi:translation initiation factor 4E|mmetsp:Transcript_33874/g.49609  ORF Transcript_33874/g.49609 Transcript_33874/m.49609 type:complete len:180 (+) Transcript_33874:84-623(+)